MLTEKRENTDGSVFILNSTEGLWPLPGSARTSDSDWTFGAYRDSATSSKAMQTGTPNETARRAYDEARAKAFDGTTEHRVMNIRRRLVFDEAGDEVDVGRYMGSDSRCWALKRRTGKTRTITIGIGLWASCGNGDAEFAATVAQGVVVAETLQSGGYSVRVMGVHTYDLGSGNRRGFVHPLVDYGRPIDEHALMAWGQPAACRDVGFRHAQALYDSDSFGRATEAPESYLHMAGIDIYIARTWSGDKQDQHIAKVLEKYQKDAA